MYLDPEVMWTLREIKLTYGNTCIIIWVQYIKFRCTLSKGLKSQHKSLFTLLSKVALKNELNTHVVILV